MVSGGTEWLNTFPHQECGIEAGALTQECGEKKKKVSHVSSFKAAASANVAVLC